MDIVIPQNIKMKLLNELLNVDILSLMWQNV